MFFFKFHRSLRLKRRFLPKRRFAIWEKVSAKEELTKEDQEEWDRILTNIHEKYGSWDTRSGYKAWELLEVGANK